jgi:hypothetical protein
MSVCEVRERGPRRPRRSVVAGFQFLLVLATAGVAVASKERIHEWRSLELSAVTEHFGLVEVRASADAKGNVNTLRVSYGEASITVPEQWIDVLPDLPLSSVEIRSEPGDDSRPWLYLFFRKGLPGANKTVEVHIAFRSGKLDSASTMTSDGKGGGQHKAFRAP